MSAVHFLFNIQDWNHLDSEWKTKNFYQVYFISGRRYRPTDAIFVVSCVVGFFIDPFYFYIWNINDDVKCLNAERKLWTSFLVLRSVVDFFYVVAFMRNCGTGNSGHTSCYSLQLLSFLVAFDLALPFPQIMPYKSIKCIGVVLRSLGSNMEASSDAWDNVFAISISISGITYRQLAKKVSKKLKFNRKIQKISPDIDLWLSRNADVPKDMKTVIMETVRYSVSLLEEIGDQVLKAISEHLNWVFYAVDSYIIREGEPLRKMFFIRQGTALTYTTRTDQMSGGSTSGSSIIDKLKKGDLYGEELLEWAFNFGSSSNLPVSTRTVVSHEIVEAFVIRAKDLKKIVSMFWWQFSRKLQLSDMEDSQLMQLKFLAISSLLRQRKAMAKSGSGWDQVYNKLIKSDQTNLIL
ncbi:hypothetical protein ACLB2K_063906 [Fragaria x ananassa]